VVDAGAIVVGGADVVVGAADGEELLQAASATSAHEAIRGRLCTGSD
jgi:hypothetical protein